MNGDFYCFSCFLVVESSTALSNGTEIVVVVVVVVVGMDSSAD